MEERIFEQPKNGIPSEFREEWQALHGRVKEVHGEYERGNRNYPFPDMEREIFEKGLERHIEHHASEDMLVKRILEEEGIDPHNNSSLAKLIEAARKSPTQASMIAKKTLKNPSDIDRFHDALMDHYQELVQGGHLS